MRLGSAILLLFVASCGDALVDNQFRGIPLFSFDGQLSAYLADYAGDHEIRVSLFWSPSGKSRVEASKLVEQTSASVSVKFPSTFRINIFYPPDKKYLVDADPPYGLALLLVYRDNDDNGKYDQEPGLDELIGGAKSKVIMYAPDTIQADQSPTGLPLQKGFSLIPIPLNCDGSFSPVTGDEDCGPELGSDCIDDSDCSPGGTCLKKIGTSLVVGGYCTLTQEPSGCAPRGGGRIQLGQVNMLQPCTNQIQCPRDGYSCRNLARGSSDCMVCWPDGDNLPVNSFCSSYKNWYASQECGQTLGQACSRDEDCSYSLDDGKCLSELDGVTFDGGYCTEADSSFGCVPFEARWLTTYTAYWFKSCSSTQDCRYDQGYNCDPVYKVCMPGFPVYLEIYPRFKVENDFQPLCF